MSFRFKDGQKLMVLRGIDVETRNEIRTLVIAVPGGTPSMTEADLGGSKRAPKVLDERQFVFDDVLPGDVFSTRN